MSNVVTSEPAAPTRAGRLTAGVAALFCLIHLLNLSGRLIEIPDFLPIVGNLDEAAAPVVLMRCLGRLGWSGRAR